jgi:hypothetical protein
MRGSVAPASKSIFPGLVFTESGTMIKVPLVLSVLNSRKVPGCHQYSNGDPDLGGKALWPDKSTGDSTHPKMTFTQESERDQDLQAAIVGGGKRYAISLAVECFLDFREAFMRTALGLGPGTSVDNCPAK